MPSGPEAAENARQDGCSWPFISWLVGGGPTAAMSIMLPHYTLCTSQPSRCLQPSRPPLPAAVVYANHADIFLNPWHA